MTRAISRDSFNEVKQYVAVHLQQGRVILDADWNEGQDIMAGLARRLGQDGIGDGVVGEGFDVQPVMPPPWRRTDPNLFGNSYFQGHLPTSVRFPPSAPFDPFESKDGWTVTGTGNLRTSRDRPYEGKSFLRLSEQTGQVTLTKTLGAPVNLSAFQYAHFRFRVSQSVPSGALSFFIDDGTRRNIWQIGAPWIGRYGWAPAAVLPLDLTFNLFDIDMLPVIKDQQYTSLIPALGTTANLTWSVTGGALPTGLSLTTATAGATPLYGRVTGSTSVLGTFTFTATANAGGPTASRSFTLRVQDTPVFAQPVDFTNIPTKLMSLWDQVKPRATTTGGGPANLASITKYGFIISPTGAAPAVWDFDALHFSSRSLVNGVATNNFAISGSQQQQFLDVQMNALQITNAADAGDAKQILDVITQRIKGTPRAYVRGLPCVQPREILYSSQADPTDPPITTPTTAVRKDLVYLDVWREPVTYIEDPELREIALGGPDTSTRMRVRQRVRVALGTNLQDGTPVVGVLPSDDGIGGGTLTTEGAYTDRSNRLYLVEVDTAGDIGTATVRWSDDNGSTIQRVIETIPPGTTKVKVEDASSFRPGDLVLLRKEFKDEEHHVSSVLGNTITLVEPTGGSTTFALADRPKLQRWNAFHAPVVVEPSDSTISAQISLSFGVKIRFGGRGLKKGDFWTFRTRFLVGDDSAGIGDVARIETVDFQQPQGVVHQYTPLAMIIRDPTAQFPDRVQLVRDLRMRAGGVAHYRHVMPSLEINNAVSARSDFLSIGTSASQSSFLCVWSGTAQADAAGRLVKITVDLFNKDLTSPALNTGRTGGESMTLACDNTLNIRTAVLVIGTKLGRDSVAARVLLEMASAGGATLVGTLDVFEVKSELLPFQSQFFDF